MPHGKTTWLAGLIGPDITRLGHLERVSQAGRVAAWIETPTLPDRPAETLRRAVDELAALTGSRYLDDKGDLLRIDAQGWGCDGLGLCLAVPPPLRVVIAALTGSHSLAAARRSVSLAPAQEVAWATLDRESDSRGIVEAIEGSRPDVLVLVGGSDGGAVRPLVGLARLLLQGMRRLPQTRWPVLFYAGNAGAVEALRPLLPKHMQVRWLPNVLPDSKTWQPGPLAGALAAWHDRQAARLTGFRRVRGWAGPGALLSAAEAARRLLRFWLRHQRLRSISGGWWLGQQVLTLHTSDGGRTFEQHWLGHLPDSAKAPDVLVRRAAPGAVWGERWRSGRLVWLDEAGLGLALVSLAALDRTAAAQALMLDGLIGYGKE